MTDRELLEMAAKAYWGDEIDDVVSIEWSEDDEAIAFTHGENQDHNGRDVTLIWNPLLNDGDALRLAVKLAILVCTRAGRAIANHDDLLEAIREFYDTDPYAATRRAIVRAAAAIGKEMP